MADGVNIDWSLAKPQQNFTDAFANAFAAGRAANGNAPNGNAMSGRPGAPAAPAIVHPANTPQSIAADELLTDGAASPVPTGIESALPLLSEFGGQKALATLRSQLDAIPKQQRQVAILKAEQGNDALTRVLEGLQQYQPAQRLAVAQHVAQSTGLFNPSQISAGDVSDIGLQRHRATAATLSQFLKTHQNID